MTDGAAARDGAGSFAGRGLARLGRRIGGDAPAIVTGLLALAIVVQLAVLGAGLRSHAAPRDALRPVVGTVPGNATPDATTLAASLFGAIAAGPAQTSSTSVAALVLTGVIATEDPAGGLAIIGESPTSARVVSVGQPVVAGVLLAAVYGQYVLIQRNGLLERVALPHALLPGEDARATDAPSNASVIAAADAEPERPPPPTASVAVLQALAWDPAVVNGREGRVVLGNNAAALAALGITRGDVVLEVNGTPLVSADGVKQWARIVDGHEPGSIGISRGGARLTLGIDNSKVEAAAQAFIATMDR